MLFKQTSIIGSAHNERADLVDMLAYAAKGWVKLVVETYSLAKINMAMQRLIAGDVRHGAVLTIRD